MKELTELFEARRRSPERPCAVATVLCVEGSSYRRAGARMLIADQGRVAGSVSGGCLERSVILEGQAALSDGRARLLTFDTTDPHDLLFGSGLGCQGKIWIGIEVLQPGRIWPLEAVVRKVRTEREPVALLTRIRREGGRVRFESTAFAAAAPADAGPDPHFIEWLAPPVALLIFGGGPDVPPLAKLAHELGHEVAIIDRRSQALPLLRPDERTAAVLMNHHYDTDRDVLAALLPLGLPYIGLLGPRHRTEHILAELRADGHALSRNSLNALHAPAGLDIGAEDPPQIALSILAEIQAALAGREGGKLKFRSGPIHIEDAAAEKPACLLRA